VPGGSLKKELVHKSGTPVSAATQGTPLNHLTLVAIRVLRLQVPTGLSQTETILNQLVFQGVMQRQQTEMPGLYERGLFA